VQRSTVTSQSVRARWALKINHGTALSAAAVCGAGIVLQPEYVLDDDLRTGALVRVLPRYAPRALPVHLVFPAQQSSTPKLRAWIDFVVEKLGKSRLPQRPPPW
jgi:DNA-binding transcriptional LysR family regulator